KLLTGAAAQILIDEGKLALSDPVAEHLSAFNTKRLRAITVEHLLTHRSGLPLTILRSTHDYPDLSSMVAAVAKSELRFEPGNGFWYSDAGADVLAAVVARVAGTSVDSFIKERILVPLAMHDTFWPAGSDDPRWPRVASLYGGGMRNWRLMWRPATRPVYPAAWGSQGLYSTPRDYARFLAMLMDGGMAGGRRILTREAVARMLTPVSIMKSLGSDLPMPTYFRGLSVRYGQMVVLHVGSEAGEKDQPLVFGHSGSDGTVAWAWPARDLMVLYFAQSRGQATAIRLELAIDEILIHPGGSAANVPAQYRKYLGTYVADSGPLRNQEFVVDTQRGNLAVDVPNQLVAELEAPDEEGKWSTQGGPDLAFSFVVDGEGEVTAMKIHMGNQVLVLTKRWAKELR
ncbi:MAG: serine hydrolase domain-containing protein, partial [Planctomycetota bacterium]